MTRLVGFLLFLAFAEDSGAGYAKYLGTPLGWVYDILLKPTAISLRPFDLVMMVVLVVSWSKQKRAGGYVAPMKNALFLILATTVIWFTLGLLKGGDFRHASWQTYLILSFVLFAFAIASAFRTSKEFCGLANWLILAGLYRGTMCWISYFTWGRDRVGESGAFLTSHEDTITWVVCILILVVSTIYRRSTSITLRNVAMMLFFVGAIQFNSRRIAWVSLAMGLIVMYALFPHGAAKRQINRIARVVVPVLLLYAVVGWGRGNIIFLPLRSLSSVSTNEDASTLARNAENLGLIATANTSSFAVGTGWGRPYIYLTLKYDISTFELWRYVPHNSILGILAFTGVFGFAGFWLAIPTAVFLNARIARLSTDPDAKKAAIIGAAQLVVCANQLYGDMGLFSPEVMYVMAVSYAMALRLPRVTGVWSEPARMPPARAETETA